MQLLTLFLLACGLGFAQAPPRVFIVNPNGTFQFVTLGPTIAIVNGALTAIAPAAALPTRIVEITSVATATATYTLGQTPNVAPELDVFWNGLVLSVGIDYTVAGSTVTFINGVSPGAGDVLRVVYRGAQ
jgi:hypothetical protein